MFAPTGCMQPCLAVDQLQQLFGNQIKAVRVAEGLGVGAHLGQLAGGGQQAEMGANAKTRCV